jgi:hypothetical protein
MSNFEMRFPGYDARSHRGLIRWELFLYRDVRDVLLTQRDDTLCVVYRGERDPIGWAQTLNEAGFPRPRFEAAPSGAITDGTRDAAA